MRFSTYLFTSALALASTAVNGCGMFEFFDWLDLPDNVKEAAMDFGYDELNWNDYKTNPIEYVKFKDLVTGKTKETVIGNFTARTEDIIGTLMELDLFDDLGICWDFYVNHYDGYTWAELDDTDTPFGHNVQDLLALLGWDEKTWDDASFTGKVPESECELWQNLDPVEKFAYSALGWNMFSFDEAPCGK